MDHRKTFLAIHVVCVRFITNTSSRNSPLNRRQVLQVRFQCTEVQGHLSQEMKNDLGAQFQMPMFARRPSIMNSFLPADTPQNSVLDSKDSRYRSFSFTNSPHLQRVSCWKIRIKNLGNYLFRFSLGWLCYGSKKWRWSIQWMS